MIHEKARFGSKHLGLTYYPTKTLKHDKQQAKSPFLYKEQHVNFYDFSEHNGLYTVLPRLKWFRRKAKPVSIMKSPQQCCFHRACGTPRGALLIAGSDFHQQRAHLSTPASTGLKQKKSTVCVSARATAALSAPAGHRNSTPWYLTIPWSQQRVHACRGPSPCSHQHHPDNPSERRVKPHKNSQHTGSLITLFLWWD